MRLHVGSRMRAGYIAMSVLLVLGGMVTVAYTYRMQGVATRLLADNISSLEAAQELEVSLFGMRGLTSNYILDSDPQWLITLERRKREFRLSLLKAKLTARSPQEDDALARISSLFAEYENDLKTIVAFNREHDPEKAKRLLAHSTREAFESIYQQCETFVSINEGFMVAAAGKVQRTNRAVRTAMYTLGFSGLAMGYILGVVISRSIAKPIYGLVLKVRGATGDELVEQLDISRGAELEDLDRHVTELIRRINVTRADLEKNRRLLARADKLAALGKVSAGVAHEIRNPLAAIKMLAYSMNEELGEEDKMRRDLSVIIREADRVDRFVHNFLKFARPPSPSLVSTNVNEVVRETLELLGPRLRQTTIQLVVNLASIPPVLLADPDQIKQVVMNLTLNGIEAMDHGGVLTVETLRSQGRTNPDRGEVQIRIADTGPGIPEEFLEDVFAPFVSGREQGTGLGLAVSYQIVRGHNGWIDAANIPGSGAVFTVSLPDVRG